MYKGVKTDVYPLAPVVQVGNIKETQFRIEQGIGCFFAENDNILFIFVLFFHLRQYFAAQVGIGHQGLQG